MPFSWSFARANSGSIAARLASLKTLRFLLDIVEPLKSERAILAQHPHLDPAAAPALVLFDVWEDAEKSDGGGGNPAAARRAGGKRGGMQGPCGCALKNRMGGRSQAFRCPPKRGSSIVPAAYSSVPKTGQNRRTSRPHLALRGTTWHYVAQERPLHVRVHARSKDLWDRHVVPSSPAPARRPRTTSGSASYSGRQRTVKTSRIGR